MVHSTGTIPQCELDEEHLLIERARRDPREFSELYSRYSQRVYAYAYRRTGSHESAEDITSDTFLLALEAIGRYEWRNVPFGAWLFRIAGNQVAMHYRKARPSVCIDDLLIPDPRNDPEVETVRNSEAETLRQAVLTLERSQRQVVELRYLGDLRLVEIALEIGRSEGAVKQLLHRATSTLRAQLRPLGA